jgi:hypothetical protein
MPLEKTLLVSLSKNWDEIVMLLSVIHFVNDTGKNSCKSPGAIESAHGVTPELLSTLHKLDDIWRQTFIEVAFEWATRLPLVSCVESARSSGLPKWM